MIGLDLVDVERIEQLLARSPEFVGEYFGTRERDTCRSPRSFACALAAKEAFVKALGEGVFGSVPLAEIQLQLDDRGRASLDLGPSARDALKAMGCTGARVSLTSAGGRAVALVMLTRSQ